MRKKKRDRESCQFCKHDRFRTAKKLDGIRLEVACRLCGAILNTNGALIPEVIDPHAVLFGSM